MSLLYPVPCLQVPDQGIFQKALSDCPQSEVMSSSYEFLQDCIYIFLMTFLPESTLL